MATIDEVTTLSDKDATNRTGKTSLNFALNIKALGIAVHQGNWFDDEVIELSADVRFWPKADMPKNAIDVAIGGKADMPFCAAYVR